jgi:Tfp pilus assembly protein PilX/cytoskeletal protein CcmA (bactofilin family)
MLKNIARLLRSERGVALPVAVSVLMVSGALAGAAATSAVTGDRQSNRDRSVKRAVAAADAGLNIAAYRLNHFATALTPTLQCVSLNATSGLLQVEAALGDNWCREQTEDLGEGTIYRYRVSTRVLVNVGGQSVWQRKIVSTGIANGVQRRAIKTVAAPSGTPLFEDAVFSDQDMVMNGAARVDGSVRSNGNLISGGAARVCGDVEVGPSKQLRGSSPACGGSSSQASTPRVLAPVVVPLTNDNIRITNGSDPRTGSISWNAAQRTLSMDGGDTLTLQGNAYVFCSLQLSANARLWIDPLNGQPVKIYIDSPESCGGSGGSVSLSGTSSIEPRNGDPSMAQLYVAGSKRTATTVTLSGNAELVGTLYAPNSQLVMGGSSQITGAVAAKSVRMSGSARVRSDSRTDSIAEQPLQIYKRQAWVECTPTQKGSAPDGGC